MDRLSRLVWLVGFPCLLVLVSWRTVSCPYTKVEESFTIQAVHDILSYGITPGSLKRYDHQVFPGAVPRSFIGPLLLAAVSHPFILVSRYLGAVQTAADAQIVVRLCLAAANVVSIAYFCQQCYASPTLKAKANARTYPSHERRQAGLFLLITAIQFHFAFWASRTIPNSLALPFVVTAMALACRNIGSGDEIRDRAGVDARRAIWLLTFSSVVLRLEIVATLLPMGLFFLGAGRITLVNGVKSGLLASSFSVLLTTMVDTYFWQDLSQSQAHNLFSTFARAVRNIATHEAPRPLWPELHGLLFNVVEGKSSEWGVSPWHAYITSLIPKLLAFTSPLVILGMIQLLRPGQLTPLQARARFLLLTAITHVAILSVLGHKEWRFAFYVLPALNVVSALGANSLALFSSSRLVLVALIMLQVALSWFTGYLSAINYPGGQALKALHEHLGLEYNLATGGRAIIHIDVSPAMTGVTLFQSIHLDRAPIKQSWLDPFTGVLPISRESEQGWVYDKSEDLPSSGPEASRAWSTFTHLLTEEPGCRVLRAQSGEPLGESQQPFEPIAPPVSSFSGLRLKSISHFKADLLSLPRALWSAIREGDSLDAAMRLGLPVVVGEAQAIWVCRRKAESTS